MNPRIAFDWLPRGGRPCIQGMRIRVKNILDLLASGYSKREIREDFPYLQHKDIAACSRTQEPRQIIC